MKKTIIMLMGGLLVSTMAFAQTTAEVAAPVKEEAVAEPSKEEPVTADKPEAEPVENPIEEADNGLLIRGANLNDVFQVLASQAGKQYFHNNKLSTDDYKVTGNLNADADPLAQMKDLAFQYGLRMYVKGDTVYAMMTDQLERLPAKEWTYSLRYLRPKDIDQIKALLQPMLTTERGIVNFEPKTNTIVIIDTPHHIEMVERLLRKIDKPKGQIVVEVKIMTVNSQVGQNTGVDWSKSLGADGLTVDIARSLNSVFGLPGNFAGAATSGIGSESVDSGSGNVILSPVQLRAVLRLLNEGEMLTQKSNPVIITEDNEKANISLIDRIPIVTTTTTTGTSTSQSEEVRYKIDDSDSTEPDKTREIGVTISLKPSLLPDNTIRLEMRPRNAVKTGELTTPQGNVYPEVREATVECITRIPNGNSLIIGGFYEVSDNKIKNKVPLLGDIPVVNFFFKSKVSGKKQSSLVFVVTPTSYDASNVRSSNAQYGRLRANTALKPGHDWVNPKVPGPAHEANFSRTMKAIGAGLPERANRR